MSHPVSDRLVFPIEPYELTPGVYRFGTRVRSRWILWARHLGDDIVAEPGAQVCSIGEGEIVWAEVRVGSPEKRNWGGLVIIEHKKSQIPMTNAQSNPKPQIPIPETFYALYGHITSMAVKVGEKVQGGQKVGEVAAGETPENGWWKIPHLHFAIYVGPWTKEILPGYKRFFDGRTKFAWWRDPKSFIEEYNRSR